MSTPLISGNARPHGGGPGLKFPLDQLPHCCFFQLSLPQQTFQASDTITQCFEFTGLSTRNSPILPLPAVECGLTDPDFTACLADGGSTIAQCGDLFKLGHNLLGCIFRNFFTCQSFQPLWGFVLDTQVK